MLLARVRRCAVCLLIVSLANVPTAWAGSAGAGSDPTGPRIRGVSPQMKQVIELGTRRSITFRTLVHAIGKSDLVVYIEATRTLPAGLDGRLTFLTSAGGVRYLHVQVTAGLSTDALIAVAGHELQHAVEVADHPEVRDPASLATLYERIGIRGILKNRYDTAAAQSAGKRVRAELG